MDLKLTRTGTAIYSPVGDSVPEHIKNGICSYVEQGRRPGRCLSHIFDNQLVQAFATADDKVGPAMHDIVKFIYNHVPAECWGGQGSVDAWVAKGGTLGRESE